MSKKCVVRRNSEGIPEMVLVKNPNISSINDRTDSGLGVSGVNFQINNIDSESPVVSIPGEILKEVQNRLMQTGLVKKINTVTNDELVNYLKSKTADYISKQVVAFHGSPHSFDKFKTDKIGTGEGNQAFGWGLYFTDLRSIAEHYAKMYNENSIFSITLNGIEDLSTYSKKVISSAILRATNSYERMLQSSGELMDELDLAMESIEDDIENNNFDEEGLKYDNITKVVIYSRDEAIKALQELKNVKEDDFLIPKGNLYKVILHKGKTSEQYAWLEWDKPLNINKYKPLEELMYFKEVYDNAERERKLKDGSDAHMKYLEEYKKLYGNLIKKYSSNELEYFVSRFESENIETGQDLYYKLQYVFGNNAKSVSMFLLKSGIDGIK